MFNIRHNSARILLIFVLVCATVLAAPKKGLSQDIVLVAGNQWLNGQGVPVYKSTYPYPGPTSYYPYDDTSSTRVGIKWQCVELPQRLYAAKGWNPISNHSSGFGQPYAYLIYGWAKAHPNVYSVTDNNGSGYVPVPGDMIIHDHTLPGSEDAGHVSVVNYVDSNNIHVVEQNASATGQATYSRSGPNGSILSRSLGDILGVVHCLANPNTNGGGVDPTNPYVDGSYSGTQIGTAANPFKTVMQAISAASATQATIHIKPGTYGEKVSTSKHILFVTWGSGTVRIGG